MFVSKNATITCGDMKLTGLTVKSVSVGKASQLLEEVFEFDNLSGTYTGKLDVILTSPRIKKTKGKQPRFVNVWCEYRNPKTSRMSSQ